MRVAACVALRRPSAHVCVCWLLIRQHMTDLHCPISLIHARSSQVHYVVGGAIIVAMLRTSSTQTSTAHLHVHTYFHTYAHSFMILLRHISLHFAHFPALAKLRQSTLFADALPSPTSDMLTSRTLHPRE